MKSDPILARTVLPADPDKGQKYPHVFIVSGGLQYLSGNSSPYFSLTYTEHRQGFPNQEESGGCNPELILHHFPQFADLAALHLSDIDGVPMHAEANGWYQLAGALGGFGEEYHAGTSKQNFPLPAARIDPARPYQTTEHRLPTREECLQMFAQHCRISIEEAQRIMAEVTKRVEKVNQFEEFSFIDPSPAKVRARWAVICNGMRPRWKREADACIARHGLTLYGDPWQGELTWSLGAPRRPVPGEAMPRTCHDLLPGGTTSWRSGDPLPGEPAYPAPASSAEQTYIDRWGITSTAVHVDHNPNMDDDAGNMNHWRVTLKRGRAKMTVYYSMGSAHAGRAPTAQEVIDCIVQDAASVDSARSFEEWARDLGYDPDSRKAHRTYTICKRQAERLQKFLGADHYIELMGGE